MSPPVAATSENTQEPLTLPSPFSPPYTSSSSWQETGQKGRHISSAGSTDFPDCGSDAPSLGVGLVSPVHVKTCKCFESKQQESHFLIISIETHWHLTAFSLVPSLSSANQICCCCPDYSAVMSEEGGFAMQRDSYLENKKINKINKNPSHIKWSCTATSGYHLFLLWFQCFLQNILSTIYEFSWWLLFLNMVAPQESPSVPFSWSQILGYNLGE